MRHEPRIPHDTEAERAILGAIIEENETLSEVIRILKPETFYTTAHQHIYQAITDLSNQNVPIDEITIGDKLKSNAQLNECGGYVYLSELIDCVPSSCNMPFYARIISEHALLRDLISITTEIGIKSQDPQQNVSELLADAEHKISEIAASRVKGGPKHIKDILAEEFQKLEERSANDNDIIGLSTGFTDLDRVLSGLIAPDLITVAGRPAMGKTAFALNIAEHVALSKETQGAILVITREMSSGQSASRMLSSNGKVSTQKIKTGNLDPEDWDRLAMATERLSVSDVYFDEHAANVNQVLHEARGLHKAHEHGLALVIVDYLQLLDGTNQRNREQEIATISRSMKKLAKELNIPVIQLSQLNRKVEERKDKRPNLSDLRESGAIEQDSDIILFIYRDEVYDEDSKDRGIAEIIIGKHRNGSPGMIKLAFQGKYARFANLSFQAQQPKLKAVSNSPHWQEKE